MVFLYAFIAVLCLGLAPFFGKSVINCINPLTAFAIRTVIAAVLVLAWLLVSHTDFELKSLPLSFWVTVTFEAAIAAVFADLAYFTPSNRARSTRSPCHLLRPARDPADRVRSL
jgi:transporter family protein